MLEDSSFSPRLDQLDSSRRECDAVSMQRLEHRLLLASVGGETLRRAMALPAISAVSFERT